jgi:hypothetical protein
VTPRSKLYEELPSGDWIRILVVEPGKNQDRIVCHSRFAVFANGIQNMKPSHTFGEVQKTG